MQQYCNMLMLIYYAFFQTRKYSCKFRWYFCLRCFVQPKHFYSSTLGLHASKTRANRNLINMRNYDIDSIPKLWITVKNYSWCKYLDLLLWKIFQNIARNIVKFQSRCNNHHKRLVYLDRSDELPFSSSNEMLFLYIITT